MQKPPTEALLAELSRLEKLREPAKRSQGQRQYDRFIVRADAELHPISRSRLDSTPIEIKLRDLGRGGLGFICPQDLPIHAIWRICFLHRGHVIGQQGITIRHCQLVGDRVYLVGAQFIIDTGLMILLGVDPGDLEDIDGLNICHEQDGSRFVPPADVA